MTNVAGIEPSTAPVEAADPRIRPLIRHESFRADVVAPGSLSLVTCFQTIEHLHDPLEFCARAAALLRPGGILLLVAHNRRALSARILGERSPIFDIEHLQLLSPDSARNLLRRAGLGNVATWGIVNSYPVSYWNRLSPLPPGLKSLAARGLAASRLADVQLPMPVGNMAVIGVRR